MKSPSWLAWLFSSLFIVAVGFSFVSRSQDKGTEAVISWDVSGYYLYLPATIIHHDLKELRFHEQLLRDYGPTPDF